MMINIHLKMALHNNILFLLKYYGFMFLHSFCAINILDLCKKNLY